MYIATHKTATRHVISILPLPHHNTQTPSSLLNRPYRSINERQYHDVLSEAPVFSQALESVTMETETKSRPFWGRA